MADSLEEDASRPEQRLLPLTELSLLLPDVLRRLHKLAVRLIELIWPIVVEQLTELGTCLTGGPLSAGSSAVPYTLSWLLAVTNP